MKTTKLISQLSTVAAGVVGLSVSGNLWAASSHAIIHDRGAIQSVAPQADTFTLKDRKNALLNIHWDNHTKFYEHGKPVASSGLKPGEQVNVAYEKQGDTLMARTVRMMEQRSRAGEHSKTAS